MLKKSKTKLFIIRAIMGLVIVSMFTFFVGCDNSQMNDNKESASENIIQQKFLHICDIAVNRLNLFERKRPYDGWGYQSYLDSYIVRALNVAYDITGENKYLDAARIWCDRMIGYQSKMVPQGFYYMNYGREPFDSTGILFTADNGSISAAVLTTAMHSDSLVRDYYLHSVELHAKVVLDKFVRPDGGITDGYWPKFDGSWWNSTALSGSLFFQLYNITGKEKYLQAGINTIKWLNKQDLETVKPFPLSEQGPSLPMYVFEDYSFGWSNIKEDKDLLENSKKQVEWFKEWAKKQKVDAKDIESQWGAKMGGIPFHLFVLGADLNDQEMIDLGDKLLKDIIQVISDKDLDKISQFMAFSMFSMAEKLEPGAMY